MSAKDHKTSAKVDYRIKEGGPLSGSWKIALGVGALGLAGAAAGFATDPKRFAFSYLFAFFCVLTPALGALFFVFVQHLTAAGWSVTVRRTAEFMMMGLPALAILSLPVLVSARTLYPWVSHGEGAEHGAEHGSEHGAGHEEKKEHSSLGASSLLEGTAHAAQHAPASETQAQHDEHVGKPELGHAGKPESGHTGNVDDVSELSGRPAVEHAEHQLHGAVMAGKQGYLNSAFFYIRAILYLVAWSVLGLAFFRLSTSQDTSKKLDETAKAQRLAPLAAVLFGISITFAGIDWVMGLDPMWYSTMFGVHIFAGAVVSMFAILILLTRALADRGLVGNAINTEHFHDMGKLLFGFNCFWSYIAFAEFFLIWYSNIPEETSFFWRRWYAFDGSWQPVSFGIAALHFAVPFVLLMSRNVKRKVAALAGLAGFLLVMHVVEYYWLVLPNFGALSISWLDIACLLGVGGVYLGIVLRTMTQHPLIPVGDPRLERALHFENA